MEENILVKEDIGASAEPEAFPKTELENASSEVEDEAVPTLEDDIAELLIEFPSMSGKSPEELMNVQRYEELRSLGLSQKEAFFATSKKQLVSADNRAHLGGSVPRSVRAPLCAMSSRELLEARELFGGISDEEIRSLYKKVTTQR